MPAGVSGMTILSRYATYSCQNQAIDSIHSHVTCGNGGAMYATNVAKKT